MNLLKVLTRLDSAATNFGRLESFVRDDLYDILGAIGDTAYIAAMQSLENARRSSTPRDEIRSAITQLGHAYSAYASSADRIENSDLKRVATGMVDYFVPFVKPGLSWRHHEAACRTALFIASCYAILNQPGLRDDYCERAIARFEKYRYNKSEAFGWTFGDRHGTGPYETTLNERIERQLDSEGAAVKTIVRRLKLV